MKFELKGKRCPYCNEDRMQGLVKEYNDLIFIAVECSDCGYNYYIDLDSNYFTSVINIIGYSDESITYDYNIPLDDNIWSYDHELEFQKYKRAWEHVLKKPYFERSL